MLEEFIGAKVVIDMRSTYVCLGTLVGADELHLDVRHADFHDLRDTETSREVYIAESVATGIKRNRKQVLVSRLEVVGISRLDDIVDG